MTLVYGSVCSGIEAATAAWHPLGWEPSFFSEIDKFPRAVLKRHYPEVPLHGDFTTIQAGMYRPIDLLVGGTPCQSFSIAGLRGGLDDDRGNLALEYLRLADRLRPRWLVWENVPGVLSSNGGRDFGSILGAMVELGYGVAYRVLDSQYVRVDGFGRAVPQRRRRVFVVGYLGDWRRAAAVLLERDCMSGNPAPRREAGQGSARGFECGPTGGGWADVAPTLDTRCKDGPIRNQLGAGVMTIDRQSSGEYGTAPVASTVSARDFKGASDLVAQAFSIMPMNSGKDYKARETDVAQPIMAGGPVGGNQGGDFVVQAIPFDTTQITSSTNGSNPKAGDPCHPLSASAHAPAIAIQERAVSENVDAGPQGKGWQEGVAYTLEARHHVQAAQYGSAVRRLTPRECERLQGFDDDFTAIPWRGKPSDQCPDGPRYKALGNSMSVNAMRWIGTRIQMVENLSPANDTLTGEAAA